MNSKGTRAGSADFARHAVPDADGMPIALSFFGSSMDADTWRVEALRSYDRPALLWFRAGEGELSISGEGEAFSADQVAFLPRGTAHFLQSNAEFEGLLFFLPEAAQLRWPEAPLLLDIDAPDRRIELKPILQAMRREAEQRAPQGHLALLHYAGLLSVWLTRRVTQPANLEHEGQTTFSDSAAHRLAGAFTMLVERDFAQPDGVQYYAKLLGITPTHLSRICRKISGRPALEVLNERRQAEARRLLRETNTKISDIAEQCGFTTAAYFTRAFRLRNGQSPSEFRNSR